MTAEQRLRFATDELERAQRDAENKRLAWLVARVAHPSILDLDVALEYAEAANLAAESQQRFEQAQIEAMAEWVERERLTGVVRGAEAGRNARAAQGQHPAFAVRAIAEGPTTPGSGAVARAIQMSRED